MKQWIGVGCMVVVGALFLLLLFAGAGCAPITTAPSQYQMLVVDAESGQPLPGVVVTLHVFPGSPDAPNPNAVRVKGNDQGEVVAPKHNEGPVLWQVQAPGYIEQRMSSTKGGVPARYAALANEKYDGVIPLYRLPEPKLTVFIGDAYAGPLTINLHPAPGFAYQTVGEISKVFAPVGAEASFVQNMSGERIFTVTASLEGQVDLTVTPLLFDIQTHQLQVVDESGALPYRDIADAENEGRGVWGVVTEDDKLLHEQIRLFVGTRDAYLEFLRTRL